MAEPSKKIKQIANRIESARSVDEAIGVLAQGLTEALGASGTAALVLDRPDGYLRGLLGWPEAKWPNIGKVRISMDEPVKVCRAVKTNSVLVSEDCRADPETKKWLVVYYSCRSILYLPLVVKGSAYGCMVVSESDGLRRFTAEEIDVGRYLASRAGKTIERLIDPRLPQRAD